MKYKSLEITDEEKESLKRYCEWEHMDINLLTSGDLKSIPKLHNLDLEEIFSREYFSSRMKDVANIYSLMCKYSYKTDRDPYTGLRTLYRGTTDAEIRAFSSKGEYDKLLSTSVSRDSALSFAGMKITNGNYEKEDTQRCFNNDRYRWLCTIC